MNAGTLNCPSCGAAAPADATECAFCHAKLATVGCPSCFGLVFLGAKFCDHCGAKIEGRDEAKAESRKCPRGCGAMARVTLGGVAMDECPACNGLWLDPDTFEHLCAQREQTLATQIAEGIGIGPAGAPHAVETVRYVPCPVCAKPMNRTNFAHSSGVIIDTCKPHGVWFDADELRRVIEFVRNGGMERARKRQLDQLTEERRLLEMRQALRPVGTEETMYERNERRLGSGASLLSVLFDLKIS